jgi:uncharacterized protein YbjT (DUF2867 family)
MNVLVTGATGTVGAHVVRALRDRGVSARALVRDPDRAVDVLGADVELAVGDFADRGSLDRALRGIDRLFLACGNVPAQVELECAAIDAAQAARVGRVVKLSGPHPAADSPVSFERGHHEIEGHLLAAGLPSVVLRPYAYMTNVLMLHAQAVRATGTLFAPVGDGEIAFVDPRDVAAVAATALVEEGHAGWTYRVTGPEPLSYERVARELSAATGRPIAYVDVPAEAARDGMLQAGLPEPVADAILAVYAAQRAGAMAGITDTVATLTGREPATFARFAREHAAAFGAAQLVS